jgi:hypothetical protein
MTEEIRTEGQKIYDELVNNKPDAYWMDATQDGVDVMKEVKRRLISLGNGVFSGYPERGWTSILNYDQVASLDRRIARWEGDLKRELKAA